MKTYRVSRFYRWTRFGAKVILTGVGGVLYYLAVTHPTPLALRLLLLAGLALFGWLFYVRLPKMPTEITISDDGWVELPEPAGHDPGPGRRHPFDRAKLRTKDPARRTRRRTTSVAEPIQEATRLPLHDEGHKSRDRDPGFLNRQTHRGQT